MYSLYCRHLKLYIHISEEVKHISTGLGGNNAHLIGNDIVHMAEICKISLRAAYSSLLNVWNFFPALEKSVWKVYNSIVKLWDFLRYTIIKQVSPDRKSEWWKERYYEKWNAPPRYKDYDSHRCACCGCPFPLPCFRRLYRIQNDKQLQLQRALEGLRRVRSGLIRGVIRLYVHL